MTGKENQGISDERSRKKLKKKMSVHSEYCKTFSTFFRESGIHVVLNTGSALFKIKNIYYNAFSGRGHYAFKMTLKTFISITLTHLHTNFFY